MAGIINLRTERKQKARADKRKQADANAARHGRTKAEKKQQKETDERLNRHLDSHERDRG
jgi:hypothetical protein